MAVTERPETVTVSAATQRRRGLALLAIAVWNLGLWGTRIRNLVADAEDFSAAFNAVHAVLYSASVLLGVVLAVIGWRLLREARRGSGT